MALSSPSVHYARVHGISVDHAFLLTDGLLAELGIGGAWPKGHYWHRWAADEATRIYGPVRTFAYLLAIRMHYAPTEDERIARMVEETGLPERVVRRSLTETAITTGAAA